MNRRGRTSPDHLSPYTEGAGPDRPVAPEAYMDLHGFTAAERALADRCAEACHAFAEALARRIVAQRTGREASGRPWRGQSADDLVKASGLPEDRQRVVLHAAVRIAREGGLEFSYVPDSKWAKRVREMVA